MNSKLRQKYFRIIQELKEKEDPVEEEKLFDEINSIFEKYNTKVIKFKLGIQKTTYVLSFQFKTPFTKIPYQKNILFDSKRSLFSNFFIEIQDIVKKASVNTIDTFVTKDEKDIFLYLKDLRESIDFIEKAVKEFFDKIPTMKTEMAFPLLMLEKEKEGEKNNILNTVGSALPFYNSLSPELKDSIISANAYPDGSWKITWNLPKEDLCCCPHCGTVAPWKATQCPVCSLDFE